ncbi:T9SS type A sorting domain-containing protein [Hymenobacter metallilatus]|uniref:T9SS C-terminal target domain-containing protein n=1 Tax=Hymenobacter metallilatus TaxID=2493666 RepID=A0A3R9M5B7_9BACT|nr:T9SS type A sorting domain-containing protein [Hymenobacter metallilatus]RSK32342.1 T9SS C-terminal target domain-containing protein [Hymenobacter metallilatus]
MTQLYKANRTSGTWRKLVLLGLLGLASTAAQAQFSYSTTSTQNVAGTYADLGTTGAVIATTNTDDDNSAATPIGFTFNFNGQAFTDFVLNTNGYIKLGTTAPVAPYYYTGAQDPTSGPLNNAAQTNLILPFNLDLVSGTTAAEYRVATTGTAPNRVCTIQWKNVSDKTRDGVGSQYDNFSFQAKLYETTNQVEFVYSLPTAVTASTDAFKLAVVGLKGSGNATGQSLVMQKGSAGAWSAAFAVAGNYPAPTATSVAAHGIRKSVLPDAGRTYRFRTVFANDAKVQVVYTLGKLPIPYGAPHTIQAIVTNVGSAAQTNVAVTATVSGANTFTSTKTIATLAAGASSTVSFDPFTPTTTGTETVRVAVANDDDNTNNAITLAQEVSATTYAYAQPGVAPSSSIGFGTGGAILAVKYTTSAPRTVSAVTARIGDPNSVGKTIYGVVTDNAGAILGRSANYTVVAADINTDKTFTLTAPASVSTGNFFAGVAQVASTTAYFPIGTQDFEVPTRTGAYFSIPLAGGTPADQGAANLGAIMIEAVTGAPATCPPPTALAVNTITTTGANVTFTGPSNGTGYVIVYGPAGFNPASAGTSVTTAASPYTLTGLTSSTRYDVYVRANCGATDQSTLTGPVTFTTACVPPIIAAFPYTEGFDGVAAGALPCGVTVTDVNNDGKTWAVVATNPASAPNAIRYTYNTASAADDWFFTPALFLRTGSNYQLSFKYRAGLASYPERLEVKYGSAATPAGQTTTLFQNANVANITYSTTTAGSAAGQVALITPATTGNYYVGFHAYSTADQFYLYVDDISISAVTGTSQAMMRAISMYPNPSTGSLNIEVRGANAKGGLEVEVTNLLGQRVHTATVRDNMTNTVDLSKLANGMYTVKVKNGSEYMLRNITIQK